MMRRIVAKPALSKLVQPHPAGSRQTCAFHSSRRFLFANDSLHERTSNLLSHQIAASDGAVVTLLKDWLQESDDDSAERMESILSHWLDNNPRPTSTQPFQIVLERLRTDQKGLRAASVLDRWGELLEGDIQLAPTLSAFHTVLDAFGGQDVDDALQILAFLERSKSLGTYYLSPNVETYFHVINTISLENESGDRRETMQELRNKLLRLQKTDSAQNTSHVVRGLGRSVVWAMNHDRSQVLPWLHQMMDCISPSSRILTLGESDDALASISDAYGCGLKILAAKAPSEKTARQAKELISHLESLGFASLPSPSNYQFAIQACSDAPLDDQTLETANNFLMRMEEKHLTKTPIPLRFYELVLRILGHRNMHKECEALLAKVMSLKGNDQLCNVEPELLTRMFNYLFQSYFHANRPDRCFWLWDRMQEEKVAPDGVTYGAVLKTLARSNHPIPKVNKVWKTLKNDPKVEAVSSHYASVAAAYSRSTGMHAASQATAILDEIEQKFKSSGKENMRPALAIYSAVITAWGRSRDREGLKRAEEIFDRMKQLHTPDVPAYSAMITTLARQRSPDAAYRAEELLDECEGLALETGDEKFRPTQICYTSVMSAWARSRSKNAVKRCEAIVQRLEKVYRETGDESYRPDKVTFGTLLDVLSKTRSPDAPRRAEELLEQLRLSGDLGTRHYTNAILCYWRSGDPAAARNADRILEEMQASCADGNVDVRPDTITYTTVIQTWASSKEPEKAIRAWELLQEMRDLYDKGHLDVKPNAYTFTAVLNSCAFTRGTKANRENAVRIALMAFTELRDYDKPTYVTYRTLLQVFGNQVFDAADREKYCSVAFQQCCKDGEVHESVVERLKRYAPALYNNLPRSPQDKLKLPPEWTINVLTAV